MILWKARETNQYLWTIIILCFITLIPISVMVLGTGWWSLIVSLISLVALLYVIYRAYKGFTDFRYVEKVMSDYLFRSEAYVVNQPEKVTVVLDSTNLEKISHLRYGDNFYFPEPPKDGSYSLVYGFYAPGVFWCKVSFADNKTHKRVFIIERVDAVDYITTVYGLVH